MKLGLNVGSGQRPFTSTPEISWCNIDIVAHPGMPEPDFVADGAHLEGIIEDASVDYFVLHHVLEHFGCNEGLDLIREAHRVLEPGGSLLVFVPDLRMLADRWLSGGMGTQLYLTNVYGAYMGSEEDRHKWGFDRYSLREFLLNLQWAKTGMFDWRVIPGMDASRDWWIAGMEAVR